MIDERDTVADDAPDEETTESGPVPEEAGPAGLPTQRDGVPAARERSGAIASNTRSLRTRAWKRTAATCARIRVKNANAR